MRIWGYIFLFLNIVAAGAFVYLASMYRQVKQQWPAATFRDELRVVGPALEPTEPEPDAEPLDVGDVAFTFKTGGVFDVQVISKATLKKLFPQGGETFGAGPEDLITNQTDEVVRVKKKVLSLIGAGEKVNRGQLAAFTFNLARTGAERSALYSLFRDLSDYRFRDESRKDLVGLLREGPTRAAYFAMASIADLTDDAVRAKLPPEEFALRRKAIVDWAISEIPDAASDEAERTAIRTRLDALAAKMLEANPSADDISAGKKSLVDAVTTPRAAKLLPVLAEVVGNPLKSAEDVFAVRKALEQWCVSFARDGNEKKLLAGIAELIVPNPAEKRTGEQQVELINTVGLAYLETKFDEAILPFSKDRGTPTPKAKAEKVRAIAHLLYHLDANFYTQPEKRRPWQERVIAIVGLNAYIEAIETQASEYAKAQDRVRALLSRDDASFRSQYASLQQRSLYLYEEMKIVESQLKDQEVLLKDHAERLEARLSEQNALQMELDTNKSAARKELANLQAKTEELYDITRKLGEAQDAIVGLEEDLKRRQRALYNKTPKN